MWLVVDFDFLLIFTRIANAVRSWLGWRWSHLHLDGSTHLYHIKLLPRSSLSLFSLSPLSLFWDFTKLKKPSSRRDFNFNTTIASFQQISPCLETKIMSPSHQTNTSNQTRKILKRQKPIIEEKAMVSCGGSRRDPSSWSKFPDTWQLDVWWWLRFENRAETWEPKNYE